MPQESVAGLFLSSQTCCQLGILGVNMLFLNEVVTLCLNKAS